MVLIFTLIISHFWMTILLVPLLMVFIFPNVFVLHECLVIWLTSMLVTKLWLPHFSNKDHKLRKVFSKFNHRHYELISKYDSGLKPLLQGLSDSESYCDLAYKLKNVEKPEFSDHFSQIVICYKRRGYKLTSSYSLFAQRLIQSRLAQLDARPTGDQEVVGSTPAEIGNILSWRLIMKYFLRSFSPFRWFKKGSCQFLAKECAQYWLTAWRTKPAQ